MLRKELVKLIKKALQATTTDKEQELEPLIKFTNKKATMAKQLLQQLREDDQAQHLKELMPGARWCSGGVFKICPFIHLM